MFNVVPGLGHFLLEIFPYRETLPSFTFKIFKLSSAGLPPPVLETRGLPVIIYSNNSENQEENLKLFWLVN